MIYTRNTSCIESWISRCTGRFHCF